MEINVLSQCSNLFESVSAFLWQLMRFNMLQLLNNLRSHSQGKEVTDADILNWANNKVKSTGRSSRIDSFKVRGNFFLCIFITLT